MQLQVYLLSLLASASTITAQAMLNWVFYEPGSDCNTNYNHESTNEDYWTAPNGFCLPMNTRSGDYDVIVSGVNVGLNTNMPALYGCPDRNCDLRGCVMMAANEWSGQGMGCQHMHNAPFWWIAGVEIPFKRDGGWNETEEAGLGPRGEGNGAARLDEMRTRAKEFNA